MMAADVRSSSLVRLLRRCGEEEEVVVVMEREEEEGGLVTRDLLGGGCNQLETQLDLDLKVPNGWEKRLDLTSGEVYVQRSSTTATRDLHHHGLASPAISANPTPNLDLKLFPPPPAGYQSVCTLDKVRFALSRLETTCPSSPQRSPSTSTSTTSTSTAEDANSAAAMVAAGCSSCLSYVLVKKGGGPCPRCNSAVEVAVVNAGRKRRRCGGLSSADLDLGLSLGRAGAGGGGEGLL